MTTPYASAREHLDEELARVALILNRQIELHWEQGLLPRVKDEFSGTFVSGGEVAALLSGGLQPSPEGQSRIDQLDAAIAAFDEHVEERLAKTRAAGEPLGWDALRTAFRLSPTEERVLWLVIAVEVSSRHRQLARYLSNDSSRVHADVGLVELCVYAGPGTRDLLIEELALDGPLFRHRLLDTPGGRRAAEDAPFLMRPLRVATRVIELCHGRSGLDREVAHFASLRTPGPPRPFIGARSIAEEIRGLTREAALCGQRGECAPALVVCGPTGSGRRSLVEDAARDLSCSLLEVRVGALPEDREELARAVRATVREAVLFRAIPILVDVEILGGDPAGAARFTALDGALADYTGPLVALMSSRDARVPAFSRGAVRVDVDLPSEGQRAELWGRGFAAAPEVELAEGFSVDRIAARYPITGGLIARATAAAVALARGRTHGQSPGPDAGRPHALVTEADVHDGLRGVLDEKMSTLGTRVTRVQSWDDLVLPVETLDGIAEFMARLRHRRMVYEQWGFSRKLAKGLGVSALFAGPPGTGKTMVAGLIATELDLDLYQIDLSRVVSKYIGETEKNLSQLFDAAEAGHAILLFDEADSLFAKRTEVKTSVDRYANLEVNYLLQRMERFDGVTILTTNLESSIDSAFKRRISFRLDFPTPQADERKRLWASMIPVEAEVDEGIDFEDMARDYEMSGGNIRNAVLRSAFLAAEEGMRISMDHLRRAADLEYQSMGKVFSSASFENR